MSHGLVMDWKNQPLKLAQQRWLQTPEKMQAEMFLTDMPRLPALVTLPLK